MKICDNGINREMTQEEIEAISNIPEPSYETEEVTAEEIAEALAEVLS